MHFGTNVCANTFPFGLRSGAPLLKRKQLKLLKCRSRLSSLTLYVFLCDSLHRNTAHLSAHLHSRIVPLSFTPMIWGNGGISCSLRQVGLRGFLYYGSQINGPEWKWIMLSTESVLKYYLWERIIYFSSPVPKKQLQTWSLSRLKKKKKLKQTETWQRHLFDCATGARTDEQDTGGVRHLELEITFRKRPYLIIATHELWFEPIDVKYSSSSELVLFYGVNFTLNTKDSALGFFFVVQI